MTDTRLVASGEIGHRLLPPADVTRLARALAWGELRRSGPVITVSSPYVRLASLSVPGLRVAVESVRLTPLAPVTMVSVDRTFPGRVGEAAVASTLAPLFAAGVVHPMLSEVLTALLPPLGPTGRRRAAGVLLGCLGATPEAGVDTGRLLTLEAWAPRDDPAILNGGRHMNVGVAFAYDSYRRRTEVWLGTPTLADPVP